MSHTSSSTTTALARREFLSRLGSAGLGVAVAPSLAGLSSRPATAQPRDPTVLRIVERDITIKGRTAKAFHIEQQDSTWGFVGERGQQFHAIVENHTGEPTALHWHGLVVPNEQDGVPYVTQLPIPPGGRHEYKFPLSQSGTYWMRSHYRPQLQRLLAAPLIVREPGSGPGKDEVVMLLADWSFRDSKVVYESLRKWVRPDGSRGPIQFARGVADYDAFLTNGRTLADPQVVQVEAGTTVRLRVINAASATNFYVELGKLTAGQRIAVEPMAGEAVAVDGQPIVPFTASVFELPVGERLDVQIRIPAGQGAYPIFAQGDGTLRRTGLVLATARAPIPKLSEEGPMRIDEIGYGREFRARAATPLAPRPVDRRLLVEIEGSPASYTWKLDGKVFPQASTLLVKQGERVEIFFRNKTSIPHGMHLHGHVFQVTELGGNRVPGARRDTLLLAPRAHCRIQFDADNPGAWLLDCPVLFQDEARMLAVISYEGIAVRDFGRRG